jgi:hypothetical protein
MWIALGAALVALAGGGAYLARGRAASGPAQPQRARDPGLAVLLAIRTLERGPDTRLSPEQVTAILPFVKALKDTPPTDPAGEIIAGAIRKTFTPAQQAALEEARRQFQDRLRAGRVQAGAGAEDGGSAVPAGAPRAPAEISDEQRAQFRALTFERTIRYLERRMR